MVAQRLPVVHSDFYFFLFGHDSMDLSICLAFSLVSHDRLKFPTSLRSLGGQGVQGVLTWPKARILVEFILPRQTRLRPY
jgi:hypothetical protein